MGNYFEDKTETKKKMFLRNFRLSFAKFLGKIARENIATPKDLSVQQMA